MCFHNSLCISSDLSLNNINVINVSNTLLIVMVLGYSSSSDSPG